VSAATPFICSFCHLASEDLLLRRFNKSQTPTGAVVDRFPLHSALVSRLSPIEICELREHCLASGQVQQLLESLITYLAGLDMSLSIVARALNKPEFAPISDQLGREIDQKKRFLLRYGTILIDVLTQCEKVKKDQKILPSFRDAVVQELL
jgi:hypothetical protein